MELNKVFRKVHSCAYFLIIEDNKKVLIFIKKLSRVLLLYFFILAVDKIASAKKKFSLNTQCYINQKRLYFQGKRKLCLYLSTK